jgi:hypothetical protein
MLALYAAIWISLGAISQFLIKATIERSLFLYGIALVFAILAIGTWFGSRDKADA